MGFPPKAGRVPDEKMLFLRLIQNLINLRSFSKDMSMVKHRTPKMENSLNPGFVIFSGVLSLLDVELYKTMSSHWLVVIP